MALSISLSNAGEKPYTPGSVVLGVVKLVTFEDQAIGALTLSFSGLTKVRMNQNYGDLTVSRSDYFSCGRLFAQQLSLYSGKFTHHKGTYAWPFAFHIPLLAAPKGPPLSTSEAFRRAHPWKGDFGPDPHPLPPTMSYRGRFSCSVEYVLQAHLEQSPGNTTLLKKNLSVLKAVLVQSLAPPAPTPDSAGDWPYINHRYKVKCPLIKSSQTMTARFFSKLRSRDDQGDAPNVELRMSVLLPKVLEVKDASALSVIVSATASLHSQIMRPEYLERTHATASELTVKSFKLSLVQHTQARAGVHAPSSERKIFVRQGVCCVPVSQSSPITNNFDPSSGGVAEATRTIEATSVNLGDVVDMTVPVASLIPDFSTYNIARWHTLDVVFHMEYERKKFRYMLSGVPIRVMSTTVLDTDLERQLSLEIDSAVGWGPGAGLCSRRGSDLFGSPTQPENFLQMQSPRRDDLWITPPAESSGDEEILRLVDVNDIARAEPPPAYTARA